MSDEVPPLKRSKRTSRIPQDIWLDSFLGLDRFSLDACQMCNRAFRSLVEHRTTDLCRRQIRETAVGYKAAVSGSTTTDGFSATFEADDRSLRVAEEDIEIFKREFKKAAVQGSIDSIDINGKMPTDKLKELVDASEELFEDIKVDGLCLRYDARHAPEWCHQLVLAVAPRGFEMVFSENPDVNERRNPWGPGRYYDARVPDQFLTSAFLMDCSAVGMIRFEFGCSRRILSGYYVVPEMERSFPVSDEAIVQFLFGNPQTEGERKLTLNAANVTSQLFKRIAEASLVSEITEDISLDLISLSMEHDRHDVQSSMRSAWSSDYDENFLHYDDWDTRCDSALQFEFPGEIRLQIFLFKEEFRMRRGRRRGWEWVPKDMRTTKENWEADNYTESEWEEMGFVDFFLGHSDYTD